MGHTISLVGHIARVTTRETKEGGTAASFSVATNRYWTTEEGRQQETTWFRCTCFGRQAEKLASLLNRGDMVRVQGRLMPDPDTGTPRIWITKSGEHRANYEVRVMECELLSRGGSNARKKVEV